ncbi:flagellar motor protein MotB [Sphingobium sp. B1D7B]|uniref:OmpA family protein n=1 Tax=unclassified Sphingobium TaxID=2611147 RepID=UPI0022259DB2|nr:MULTISPECIES: OmpA family protein [unclassified Sphingobium]MCW2390494.1 flagellar motor protein MotB [Sphingobium sp. B11D3A]MCW2405635.1 flagellar motor protein MotB [Sphingobium sp. B1D7B]
MSAQPRQSRARWALSFADLCLLLLAFFALLQSNQTTRETALAGIGSYFGAFEAPRQANLVAQELFEPGEALLNPAGRAALLKATEPIVHENKVVRIQSIGLDSGDHRFDAWDLAAARLGAVARTLVAAGVPEKRLRIAGLAERPDASAPGKQTIRITELAETDP